MENENVVNRKVPAGVRTYMATIGRKGGRKSRRILSAKDARAMVRVREARRAFRKYYAQCFWSCDPKLTIGFEDVDWVARRLQEHGDRAMWLLGRKLQRS